MHHLPPPVCAACHSIPNKIYLPSKDRPSATLTFDTQHPDIRTLPETLTCTTWPHHLLLCTSCIITCAVPSATLSALVDTLTCITWYPDMNYLIPWHAVLHTLTCITVLDILTYTTWYPDLHQLISWNAALGILHAHMTSWRTPLDTLTCTTWYPNNH